MTIFLGRREYNTLNMNVYIYIFYVEVRKPQLDKTIQYDIQIKFYVPEECER